MFVDKTRRTRPLALHPDAIGVAYPPRKTENVAEVKDGVAVLCDEGQLEHKGGGWWSFWQTYEDLAISFKALCDDPDVKAIVLKFDSPGGEVSGLNETVAIMQKMKRDSGKTVCAYVDEACYSAAYALAMVADDIYLPESGGVGSIGVITTMLDVTERDKKDGLNIHVLATGTKKTDHHPHFPLTDGALKRARKGIDALAIPFFEMVSRSRGLTTEAIEGYQAGTFQGSLAVEAGLADAVMSLSECLTLAAASVSSSKGPNDRSVGQEKANMSGILTATKAVNDANTAMASAKTDADKALCAARIVAAEAELAKVKKLKTKDTVTHVEEEDDGESESADDESEDDESESEDEESESESSDGSSDSSSSSESESAHGKKYGGDDAKTGLHTKDRLLRLCRQIVGSATRGKIGASHKGKEKMSIEQVMGALHATWQGQKEHAKLAAEVAKLKAGVERDKLKAMVASGVRSGKIAPAQVDWAKSQSPASLRAYLDNAPVIVSSSERTESKIEGAGVGGVTAAMARIWSKQGFTEKDFPALLAKLNASTKSTNGAS